MSRSIDEFIRLMQEQLGRHEELAQAARRSLNLPSASAIVEAQAAMDAKTAEFVQRQRAIEERHRELIWQVSKRVASTPPNVELPDWSKVLDLEPLITLKQRFGDLGQSFINATSEVERSYQLLAPKLAVKGQV